MWRWWSNPKMQNMLRMIGYGENLGSGFPMILSAWKQAGWAEPVLENRLEVDEVSLVLPIKRIEGSAPKSAPQNWPQKQKNWPQNWPQNWLQKIVATRTA